MTTAAMVRALAAGAAAAAAVAGFASSSSAAPPAKGGPLRLEIRPGGGPQRTGAAHTLEVRVRHADGEGANGVTADFEVMEGPGDDDVGTAGPTPETPDLSCVTAGGTANRPAICAVSYVEQDNAGGSDAILAWIDADGDDATVEADLGEGENENAPGPGGCAVDTKGPGVGPEPDASDCVIKRWIARVPATIDLSPENGTADVGANVRLEAFVRDQYGSPLTGPGTAAVVGAELMPASAHDPGDGADFAAPDAGSCSTGETARCVIDFGSSKTGTDVICAYLPGQEAACSEPADSVEWADGADVVSRTWGVVAPAPDAEREKPGEEDGAAPGKDRHRPRPKPDRDPAPPEPPGDVQEPEPNGGGGRELPPPAPPDDPGPTPATSAHQKRDTSKRRHPAPQEVRPRARRAERSKRAHPRHRAARPSAARSAAPPTKRARDRRDARTAGRRSAKLVRLSKAAARTAERYSFPLGLTLLVLAFIAVQSRIDRRDPKLRLAPVDSKHDLLPFT